ncbi:hypothetical protein ANN_20430 [Periplaneta americana]|uniref:Uncharacterized protein n=1 Tax=Periplaneta americana TaxID=6978 RepID=A0ABQ8SDD7_PERAM|nr:hypothetical protein ANN_20430 [Periplaneta americana]
MAGLREGGNEPPGSLKVSEMSPGSSTESYPAFARIGLRENPGKNLNQVTCPDRDSNPGHLVSWPDALTVTPQLDSIWRCCPRERNPMVLGLGTGLVRQLWYQLDGAPAHFTLPVRQWLDHHFPGRWIGRGGPIAWPARSPDLTPFDFFLWGCMIEKVYQTEIASREELVAKINTAAMEVQKHGLDNVQREVRRRAEECVRARGRHFEHLLRQLTISLPSLKQTDTFCIPALGGLSEGEYCGTRLEYSGRIGKLRAHLARRKARGNGNTNP